jgi:hypothetical protein
MRGGDEAATTFATESFIDEMARALHAEPLAFRIGLLGGAPRLARAITTAAAIGGWDGGAPGSTMGLACAALYGSFIGLLAEATISPDQRIKVSRLVAAVDAGRIVNPGPGKTAGRRRVADRAGRCDDPGTRNHRGHAPCRANPRSWLRAVARAAQDRGRADPQR